MKKKTTKKEKNLVKNDSTVVDEVEQLDSVKKRTVKEFQIADLKIPFNNSTIVDIIQKNDYAYLVQLENGTTAWGDKETIDHALENC